MTHFTLRASRVGWRASDCNTTTTSLKNPIENGKLLEQSGKGLAPEIKKFRVTNSGLIAINYFLLEDIANSKDWAMTTVECAEDYFFGDWRDQVPVSKALPPSREFQDKNRPWVTELQFALIWSAALGEWMRFEHFSSFPRDDISSDEGIVLAQREPDFLGSSFRGLVVRASQ